MFSGHAVVSLLRLLRVVLGSTICYLLCPVLYEALKERSSSEHTTVFVLAFQHGVKARWDYLRLAVCFHILGINIELPLQTMQKTKDGD